MPACKVCAKSVYPMDPQVNLDGILLHKACAKCQDCNCQISLSNFTKNETKESFTLLCKTHYFKRFRENGSYPGAEQFQKNVNRNETAAILAQKVITTAGPTKTAVAPQLLGTVPMKSSSTSISTSTPVKSSEQTESGTPSQWKNALKKSSIAAPSNDSLDTEKSSTPTQWSSAIKRTSISKTNSDDQTENSSTPQAWNNALKRGSKSSAEETTIPSETNSTPQAWNSAIRRKSVENAEASSIDIVSTSPEANSTPQAWNSAIKRKSVGNSDSIETEKEEVNTSIKSEVPASETESNILEKPIDPEVLSVPVVESSTALETASETESNILEKPIDPKVVSASVVESSTPLETILESSTPSSAASSSGELSSMHARYLEEQKDQLESTKTISALSSLSNHLVQKKSPITIPIEDYVDDLSDSESAPVYATDRDELEDSNLEKMAAQQSESKEDDEVLASKDSNENFDDDLSPVKIKEDPVAFI